MQIKGLKDEDFVNYAKPSMFIISSFCSFKCDKEYGCTVCQNSKLAHDPIYNISNETLIQRYIQNDKLNSYLEQLFPFNFYNVSECPLAGGIINILA